MASVASEGEDSISLNIMPMLDIFSILILFLLMSFSSDPMTHDLNKGVELPESLTLQSLDEIPALMLTRDKIYVNDKKIVNIVNGDVAEKHLEQGGIYPLLKEMIKLAEANDKYSKDKKKVRSVTVEIDKNHTFKLIKRVLLTAQQTDFVKFKLMVSKSL
jgi:biopolymer transport protein ExbD